MDIKWINRNGSPLPPKVMNSEDPNEPMENGIRTNCVPYTYYLPDDEKYFMIRKRMFSNGPKPKFIQRDRFTGSLEGYIFQMGPKGLGYYIDPYVIRHIIHK